MFGVGAMAVEARTGSLLWLTCTPEGIVQAESRKTRVREIAGKLVKFVLETFSI
jgi:hypothetical protein